MNTLIHIVLKIIRKIYKRLSNQTQQNLQCVNNADEASKLIIDLLSKTTPCMITRFGSTELNVISNYRGIKEHKHKFIKYIKGESPQWWWNEQGIKELFSCSGFFPTTENNIISFSNLMINNIPNIDILGSWRPEEYYFKEELKSCKLVSLRLLEPFWSSIPWTSILENKNILVIHPFADTIEKQYKKRELLFTDKRILPTFKNFYTIKAIQSLGGYDKRFKTWFEALSWMEQTMDSINYDICLIGCGAYGFPLAAHAKKQGKKAIHLGGSLQLLFGIKGKRWESPYYGVKEWGIPIGSYTALINEYWVHPSEDEKPTNAQEVENACYW